MGSFIDPNTGKRVNAPGIATDAPDPKPKRPRTDPSRLVRPATPPRPGSSDRQSGRRQGEDRAIIAAPAAARRAAAAKRKASAPTPSSTPAPPSTPVSRPAPKAPAASSPKPAAPKTPKVNRPPATPVKKSKPGAFLAKARKATKGAGAIDKDTLNRAINRYRRTHKGVSLENARTAAAYLAQKEHKGYTGAKGLKKKKKVNLPGPDTPPKIVDGKPV